MYSTIYIHNTRRPRMDERLLPSTLVVPPRPPVPSRQHIPSNIYPIAPTLCMTWIFGFEKLQLRVRANSGLGSRYSRLGTCCGYGYGDECLAQELTEMSEWRVFLDSGRIKRLGTKWWCNDNSLENWSWDRIWKVVVICRQIWSNGIWPLVNPSPNIRMPGFYPLRCWTVPVPHTILKVCLPSNEIALTRLCVKELGLGFFCK